MPRKKAVEKKPAVRVLWSKRPVTLLAKGETVSEIKWNDSGAVQAIPNDQLEFN